MARTELPPYAGGKRPATPHYATHGLSAAAGTSWPSRVNRTSPAPSLTETHTTPYHSPREPRTQRLSIPGTRPVRCRPSATTRLR